MSRLDGFYRLRLLLLLIVGCSLAAAPLQGAVRRRSTKSSSENVSTKKSSSSTKKKSAASAKDDDAPAKSSATRKTSTARRAPAREESEVSFDGWASATASAEKNAGESWTAVIEDLATTETIFAYHASQRLVPASNRKVITFGMALENLGPDYQFQTEFGLSTPTSPGRPHYHGDVILRSNGDPSLTDPFLKNGRNPAEIFRAWAKSLKDAGIETIFGNIIIDASAFGATQNAYPVDTWGPNHKNQTYAPIPSALALCQNLMRITVSPSRSGGACRVDIFPADEGISIVNNTRASSRRGVSATYDEVSQSLELSGGVNRGGTEVNELPIPHPLNYIARLLQRSIAEQGIKITGQTIVRTDAPTTGTAPVLVQRLGTHESPPLVQMLYLMMQQSNNFLAEQFWRAAAARAKGCGDVTRARQAEIEWYRRHGLAAIEPGWDGSGLSRKDLFSARDMAAIARSIYNTAYQAIFLKVLPTAGKSGTMRHRSTALMDGRVTAKTGTLAGVSSLTGFIMDDKGRARFVFSVIANAPRDTNGRLANRINDLMNVAIRKLDADIAAGRRPVLPPPPPAGAHEFEYAFSRSTLAAGSADFVGADAERMGAERESLPTAAVVTTSTLASTPPVENGTGQGR